MRNTTNVSKEDLKPEATSQATFKVVSPNRWRRVLVTLPTGGSKVFATREDGERWADSLGGVPPDGVGEARQLRGR